MAKNDMNLGPYVTGGNSSHPGVQGQPYNAGPLGGFEKLDNPGTGTFPSHMHGTINRAQPAGLSSTVQYGHMSPGSNQGQSPIGDPVTHPVPEEMEGVGAGRQTLKQNQPMIAGVNVAHGVTFDEKGNQQESESQKRPTAAQAAQQQEQAKPEQEQTPPEQEDREDESYG